MTETDRAEDGERATLRSERDRLESARDALQAESSLFKDSLDTAALNDLTTRLQRHRKEVEAYSVRLHAFHQRVGPLDRATDGATGEAKVSTGIDV